MKLSIIKELLCKNFNLKIISLIIGYGLWHITSQSLTIEHTFNVPVAFYNTENKIIKAPDHIHITLKGKRKTLRALAHHLTLHIDAKKLSPTTTTLAYTKEDLFLPDTVGLVHCTSNNSLITITC